MIKKLDTYSREAFAIALAESYRHNWLAADECYNVVRQCLTNTMIAASAAILRPQRGRRSDNVKFEVIKDIAAIFEWATGAPAGRSVDRVTHEETGPFRQFAEAIWPVIFHNADVGLANAMKKLARRKLAARQAIQQTKSSPALPWAKPSLISEGDDGVAAEQLYGPSPPGASPFDTPFVIRCVAARHPTWQILML